MFETVTKVLETDARVSYALVFGSSARGTDHAGSDLDVAIGLAQPLSALELGALISRLESATGRAVDLTLLGEAPPGLAYRVFRDGVVVLDRDHEALVGRKAKAVLEYLDWQPIEALFARAGNGNPNGR
ncbi:MAG TPA: nucleotidyltransferase domain-containing protein [Planctomycetota bacterium]|nr:nucleotidyltransferase domain-containing protein [Planctomycetota bacterium]